VRDSVIKPEFTRFASQVFFDPGDTRLQRELNEDPKRYWLVQQCVRGAELCVYAWVCDKKVITQVAYSPEFRVGLGASVRFVRNDAFPEAEECVRRFVSELPSFEGQIAFDLMKSISDWYALECNPRATSGLHLLAGNRVFLEFLAKRFSLPTPVSTPSHEDRCLWWVLLLQGPKTGFRNWLSALWHSQDIVFQWQDPLPAFGQLLVTLRVLGKAMLTRSGVLKATTEDIEYNGDRNG
jgi:hypothetical protein